MPAMMTYDAYLEILPYGETLAQVTELPGCYAKGASENEALNRLYIAVPDYYRWLRMQDEETPTMSGDVAITVRERVPVTRNALHEVRAFFTSDDEPLNDDDLDWGLALMSYAHQDFTRQLRNIDEAVLEWQPDSETRNIRQVIDHVAQAEAWLARRLDEPPTVPLITELPGPPLERLNRIHERSMIRLSKSTPEQRELVREINGERWSLRKIVRRSILNEREHTEQIAVLLARYASR
jgi:predicted RNase H-like HicB family nuclease